MSKRFDVVVIGGRLSAVLTATLLTKRGLRGLLIDQGELRTLGSTTLADQLCGWDASKFVQAVFQELELRDTLLRAATKLGPVLQVVFPDRRFELSSEAEVLRVDMDRFLGGGARTLLEAFEATGSQIETFLEETREYPAPTGWFGRRAGASAARRAPYLATTWRDHEELARLPEPFLEFVRGMGPFVTHQDVTDDEDLRLGRSSGACKSSCRAPRGSTTPKASVASFWDMQRRNP
ncbi:MAG: hypothetical protein HC923_05445 [Myxococcales bacterium]|nr:hypothetical protein [Myxococcales bacterium]